MRIGERGHADMRRPSGTPTLRAGLVHAVNRYHAASLHGILVERLHRLSPPCNACNVWLHQLLLNRTATSSYFNAAAASRPTGGT